jgi:diketogulonate reductase-like aldo/keto reductase
MEHVSVQGEEVPAVGLGTWRLTGEDCREAVGTALDLGYRHLDTAQAYGNERQVGDAIRGSDVPREDVFLTTKLSGSNRTYDDVQRSVQESLAKLGTDHVDLLLIHTPNRGTPLRETLDSMNELVEEGTIRHVGVSNFGVDRLERARSLSDAPIFTDQVQFHPYWDQTGLLDYCAIHDVLLTAYSPLGHGGVLSDPAVREVATRHGVSPAQVALRWAIQHEGVVAIPKATSRDHLAANLDVFDFELSEAEMEQIRQPSKLRTAAGFVRSRLPI